ncbi:MAG: ribonuclease P protein component [Alphaproteobacteria bacterium]|nr:MAG: ribonuclease P protein component [Alphaproteobacteria bacterium]
MTQTSENSVQKNAQNEPQKISVLAKRRDFLRIASGRKKWVSSGMIVQVATSPEHEGSEEGLTAAEDVPDIRPGIRVGYTASKKVGNAVRRNRAKRRLRQVVHQVLATKGLKGHDYVLIARTACLDMSFDQLIRDFSWCLKRLNGTKSPSPRSPASPKGRGKADKPASGRAKR